MKFVERRFFITRTYKRRQSGNNELSPGDDNVERRVADRRISDRRVRVLFEEALKALLHRQMEETITDDMAQRVLTPVIEKIKTGDFD